MNNNVISNYNIQDKWLEKIAPKYMNMEQTELLRIGLLGYLNEIMSDSVESNNFNTSSLYNEIFPNKAVLPSSIYAYSALAQVDDYNATCATMSILLVIKKDDIISKSKPSATKIGLKEFFISKDSIINVNNQYQYLLKDDIIILIKNINDKVVLTPVYKKDSAMDNMNTNGLYIKSTIKQLENEEFIFLNLIVEQKTKTVETLTVASSNLVDIISYDVEYQGQLADFEVIYKATPTSTPIKLTKYFMEQLNPTADYFCFYEYTDENKLRIFFSPFNNYFRPSPGSTLTVNIYTTQGSNANFEYTGNNITFSYDTMNSSYDYSKVITFVNLVGSSQGGMDAKTLTEIKQESIDLFSSRDNIITSHDLSLYFNKNKKYSNILFLKNRDDVFRRIFSTFILLRDKNNNILPTNTVKLGISNNNISNDGRSSNYIISCGSKYMFNEDNNTYEFLDKDLSFENIQAFEKMGKYVVTTPFLIKINSNPLAISYYLNSLYERYYLNYNYMNYDVIHEFLINYLNIYRDPINELPTKKQYKIETSLTTTVDLKTVKNLSVIKPKTFPFKLKGLIKIEGINNPLGYIDFTPTNIDLTNNVIKFESVLYTNDSISNTNDLELINCVKNCYDNSNEYIDVSVPITGVNIELAMYYNGYESKDKKVLANLSELKDYTLTNMYENNRPIELMQDLTNIINSVVNLDYDDNNNFMTYIASTPVLRYLYFKNQYNNVADFYSLIKYNSNILMENIDILENNFEIDLKFYNTYGKSNNFLLNNEKDKPLNQTNISMKFKVKLSINISTEIDIALKNSIIEYVETLDIHNNSLYISNLISDLQSKFSYITYIDFQGINNNTSTYQVVENQYMNPNNLVNEHLIKFVPEYLVFNRTIDSTGKLIPDIIIEYV